MCAIIADKTRTIGNVRVKGTFFTTDAKLSWNYMKMFVFMAT